MASVFISSARYFFTVFLYFCWAGYGVFAQSAQLDFRNYSTADGLPSSETYTVFEDREGYIWIGTDNGVARFDGYEFTIFDRDDGLEDMVVFTILEDERGVIWVSTFSGRVFYFEAGRFHPYRYNHVLLERMLAGKVLEVMIDVLPGPEVVLRYVGIAIAKVDSLGNYHELSKQQTTKGQLDIYDNPTADRRLVRNHAFNYRRYGGDGELTVSVGQGRESEVLTSFEAGQGMANRTILYAAALNAAEKKQYVIASPKMLCLLDEPGSIEHLVPGNYRKLNYVMSGQEAGEYWLFNDRGVGLKRLIFEQGATTPRVDTYLKGHSLSTGLIDSRGGFWITTIDAGVFYSPYPKQRLYKRTMSQAVTKSISVCATGPNSFYAGFDDGAIYRYDGASGQFFNIMRQGNTVSERIHDLFFDEARERIFSLSEYFDHPVTPDRLLTKDDLARYSELGLRHNYFHQFVEYPRTDPGVLYVVGQRTAVKFDLTSPSLEVLANVVINEGFTSAHSYGLSPDGREVLGTLYGLFAVDEAEVYEDNLGVPELEERIIGILPTPAGARVFGTRGEGVVYHRQDTTFIIREVDGLASDLVRHIHWAADNTLWVSTLNGISKVSFSPDENNYSVRSFNTAHGLPTNEVYQVDTYADQTWLATPTGIFKFVEPALDSLAPPPKLIGLWDNDEPLGGQESWDLPAGRHDFSISYGSLNFVLGNRARYRYRLDSLANWQYTNERTANYSNLGPGRYNFTVQSENQDGYWSESLSLPLSIATPWYQTWWAFFGLMALVASIVSLIFLVRERRRKREQDLLLQINKLEHAALHAQMNPHFVFNALNSIQNFVLKNDARQAATYLSRFASIIRQTLRSSVNGRHSLAEEIKMLSTYLVLEKLRFKEGFTYDISVAEHLPQQQIQLPPLLIQPFVENAILHGLKEKQSGGRIMISFTGSVKELLVTVEDNGRGYQAGSDSARESLGMEITRRRLDMMNGALADQSGMEVETLFTDNGTVAGTRVTIYIHLKNEASFVGQTA